MPQSTPSQEVQRVPWDNKPALKQITLRATIAGIAIGSLVLTSNFQFGLQTGWVSMMSLPSALLACAFFKNIWPLIFPNDRPFSDVENVYVQSMAVAVGTGPLAFGFVGVIPAIEKFLTNDESGGLREQGQSFTFRELLIWSTALAFFGIFFAVPLRKQVIVREKLPFPSGSATATLISVLNGTEILQEVSKSELLEMRQRRLNECPEVLQPNRDPEETDYLMNSSHSELGDYTATSQDGSSILSTGSENYRANIIILLKTFVVSSLYTMVSYFVPVIRSIPVFGKYLSNNYLWNFQPSPAYIGQGIIMGLPTVSYMLIGCFLGWGVLAPLARYKGWVPPDADVHDWEEGVQGWILWSSLSIMVADSVVAFIVVTVKSIVKFMLINDKAALLNNIIDDTFQSMLLEEERAINSSRRNTYVDGRQDTVRLVSRDNEIEVDSKHLVRYTTVISGCLVSSIICIVSIIYLFGIQVIPLYAIITALILALFLSILGIRALGETDLNPVSGIGKISQLIFAFIIPRDRPGSVLMNVVSGGIAEASAQQAGDLMQDLKTGHLLGASPRAQFCAQLIGACWSIILSSFMYLCYNKVYSIPSEQFRIPTAVVWIDCARLVTGKGLPDKALECSMILGVIFAVLSLIRNTYRDYGYGWILYIPSGVAVGVGIFNSPSFTIARFIGGWASHFWLKNHRGDLNAKTKMIVFSSGLVLGEGIFSVINMVFTCLNVPHY
ncbi:hypothetical protein H826_YJM1463G00146 [Saccharomyces cerevisiae YJM1463]|nr:hypothetical protein H826_YJM1463G00146 [Saccharomyces cerevisiae YJM1463]